MTYQAMLDLWNELSDGTPHETVCPHCQKKDTVMPCREMRQGLNYGVVLCGYCNNKYSVRSLADAPKMESAIYGSPTALKWIEESRNQPPLHSALEPVP